MSLMQVLRSRCADAWPRTLGAVLLAFGAAFSATAFAQDDPDATPPGEGEYLDGSQPFVGPIVFEPGVLELTYSAPGYPDFGFTANAIWLEGYPGSVYLHETPIGPSAVLQGLDPQGPDYYFVAPSLGVFAPLSYEDTSTSYVGTIGSGTIGITVATTPQDPAQPKYGLAKNKNGTRAIIIKAPCKATFKQFFTRKITWKGTKPNPNGGAPVPTGGDFDGPIAGNGNGGQPTVTDGGTAYVDAPPGNGDYPGVQNNRDGTTSMLDAPNVTNPDGLAGVIAGQQPAGTVVTEVTVTWHFTTYILCGGVVTWKVEWYHTETVAIPAGPPPHHPNGGFGGRSQGPPPPGSPWNTTPPDVSPATGYDPHHQAALTNFQGGNYSGAPAPGGW